MENYYFAVCPLHGRSGHEAGRELLARLYREATGDDLPPIHRTPRGKPFFPDSPWHFSVSHTPRRVFCVLARENIAVDAEEADRAINPALAEKILSPGEKAQFCEAEDKQRCLLQFWVLKEAAAKLSGEGLRGYPNHTNFHLPDPRVQYTDGCFVAVMTEGDAYAV